MVSLTVLQAEADELHSQAPLLPPSIVPHGHQFADVLALAEEEGKASMATVSDQLRRAAKGVRECQLCGRQGSPSTSSRVEADDLAYVVFTKLRFASKAILAVRGAFACGRCRAVASTSEFLQFATPQPYASADTEHASGRCVGAAPTCEGV